MADFHQIMTALQKTALDNTQEIMKMKEENGRLSRITGELSADCTRLTDENVALKEQVNGVEQYLRINNLEISGLEPIRDRSKFMGIRDRPV